ncbi:MAG: FtsX-like permease family protein [Rhodothermales bacterium]|nr:FtsX-like permease family protein [Rhodothermales bacterium]
MLKNYLTIGLRILKRNPAYTAINIIGLSIGIASCLVILAFVSHETSYDSFHTNADQIYRVFRTEHRVNNPTKRSESTASPLAEEIRSTLPGVQHVTRYMLSRVTLLVQPNQHEVTIAFVDPDFFNIFDFGSPENARGIESRDGIIATQSASTRFYGDSLDLGDTIEIFEGTETSIRRVSALIEDPPSNSSFQFDFIAAYGGSGFYLQNGDSWTSFRPSVYLMSKSGIAKATIEDGLAAIISTNMGERIASSIEQGWLEDRDDAFTVTLQSLDDVHFASDVDAFNIIVSSRRYSNILLLIAAAILFIACVNFVTQSIGRADLREREVEMRRSLGAGRLQLITQFLGESLVIMVAATIVAVFLSDVMMPFFNSFTEQQVPFDLIRSPRILFASISLIIVCTLAAGLYPALYLARERYKESNVGRSNVFVRGVVVTQFAISIGMIAAVLVIHNQMQYIDSRDLGFEAEQLVLVDMNAGRANAEDVADLYQDQLDTVPGVLSVSGSSSSFGDDWSRTVLVRDGETQIVYTMRIDPEFLETTGIELVSGRALSASFGQDADNSIVVNEAFVETLNLEDPVGSYLAEFDSVQVVGVVADFNFLSLREEVPPTILHMSPLLASENYTMVRFATGNIVEVMDGLEAAWSRIAPDEPFVVEFLDDRLRQLYSEERRWQRVILFSAALAIVLSCLGLFGIAAMNANRRMKEIGIRKVLGSSVTEILRLLSTETTTIVLIAFTISAPVAWFLLNRWLDSFAFSMPLGPSSFIIAGLITLLIALATVGHQSLRAALRNPVDVLRSE